MLLLIILIITIGITVAKLYLALTIPINKCSKHLVGKVVIVTGGNAGIGFETAKDLANRGAKVIIGCRNERRGTSARDKIIAVTENTQVYYRNIDLASLTSVRKFAEEIIKTEKQLHILINNAGIFDSELLKTEDGLLLGSQVNHFGPFLLTNLLLPLLKSSSPSRIINVSSLAYLGGTIDFDNLNMEIENKGILSSIKLYCNTKLANILMTVELRRILEGTGVTVNVLHPGWAYTSILDEVNTFFIKCLYVPVFRFLAMNAWEGAQTTIYLAVSPEVKDLSGCYFSHCKEENVKYSARDPALARKLWKVSEQLVKLNH